MNSSSSRNGDLKLKPHASSISIRSNSQEYFLNHKNNNEGLRKNSQLSGSSKRTLIHNSDQLQANVTATKRFKTEHFDSDRKNSINNNKNEKRMNTDFSEQFAIGSPFQESTPKKVGHTLPTTAMKTENESALLLDNDTLHFVEKVQMEKQRSFAEELNFSRGSEKKENKKEKDKKEKGKAKDEESAENNQNNEEDEEEDEEEENSKYSSSGSKNSLKLNQKIKKKDSDGSSFNYNDEGLSQEDYLYGFSQSQKIRQSKIRESAFKKKPVIRSFSSDQKQKILTSNRYNPKNQEEKRMEEKYIKGRMDTVTSIKQIEQFEQLLEEYRKNKTNMLQFSTRKHEMRRIMANAQAKKGRENGKNNIERVISLPKLLSKGVVEIQLPLPVGIEKDDQKNTNREALARIESEVEKVDRNSNGLHHSLSAQRFEYENKRKKLLLKYSQQRSSPEDEIDNIEHIYQVFKNKGLEFDSKNIRKGLTSERVIPELLKTERIDPPAKNLISNPTYKKYPL